MRRGTQVTTLRRSAASWLAGRGPSATAVLLLVLVVLVASCDRKAAPPSPPSHRLEGTYIVHGEFPKRNFGGPCRGAEAGYPSIQAGTMVVVKDEGSAAVLGSVPLQGGTLRKGLLRGTDDDCVFTFSLTVPERDAYRIKVGRQPGNVRFTRADLERTSWKADLTVGSYTMFGGI
jgi:hypothetical protein